MRGGGSVDRGGHASQALLDARGGGLGVVARGGGGAVNGRGGRLDARGVVRAGGGRERGDVGGEARGDPDESRGGRLRRDVSHREVVARDADVRETLEEILRGLVVRPGHLEG